MLSNNSSKLILIVVIDQQRRTTGQVTYQLYFPLTYNLSMYLMPCVIINTRTRQPAWWWLYRVSDDDDFSGSKMGSWELLEKRSIISQRHASNVRDLDMENHVQARWQFPFLKKKSAAAYLRPRDWYCNGIFIFEILCITEMPVDAQQISDNYVLTVKHSPIYETNRTACRFILYPNLQTILWSL